MKLLLNSASRLPGPSGNQSEKVHGQSEERYKIAESTKRSGLEEETTDGHGFTQISLITPRRQEAKAQAGRTGNAVAFLALSVNFL